MRLCLVGDFSWPQDEGMRNTAFCLVGQLSKSHNVLNLNINDVFSVGFWKSLRDFNPEILHYIPGPSLYSFVLVKLLSFSSNKAKTVMSATHPGINVFSNWFIPWIKPHLVLTLSAKDQEEFSCLGCKTYSVPVSVDLDKFVPVSQDVKYKLREKRVNDKDKR